jgi:hypothetical protein
VTLRFRKSIKLAPGIRWNFSSSGSSWTIGPRGASISIGKRGTFLNTGIPGTGLSSRTRLSGPAAAPRPRPPTAPVVQTVKVALTCDVQDDGTITFLDSSGKPASPYLVEQAKKQQRDVIAKLIQETCDKINGQIEALGRLHYETPDPRRKPQFVAPSFEVAKPVAPVLAPLGFLDRLIPSRKARIEAANQEAAARHAAELHDWTVQKADFEKAVARRKLLVERLIYQSDDAMEIFLEESLHDIVWPRETMVALEVRSDEGGRGAMLDIDLPEFEQLPTKFASVPSRGLKLSVKDLSAAKLKRLYADHVHGIVFRMVGEAFAALPAIGWVTAAGYSQRRDPATAQLRDEYLLSVRVDRAAWEENDFGHLGAIDVVEALARFDLRRDMTKAGQIRAITPHAASDGHLTHMSSARS